MFTSIVLASSLLFVPVQPATKSPEVGRVAVQQILLDTGGGGGDALPPLNLNCSLTPGGFLACFLRWGL